MRHRNHINAVKHAELRRARLPALKPIGEDRFNFTMSHTARLTAQGDRAATCGHLSCIEGQCQGGAKPVVLARFAVGDVLCPLPERVGCALVADAEYIVAENRDDYIVVTGPLRRGYESNRSFPPDRFELVRRAAEELPNGWVPMSGPGTNFKVGEPYREQYVHPGSGARVYRVCEDKWNVFGPREPAGISDRNEAMRLALTTKN